MRLVVRREAEAELDEAFRWYEERSVGLGSRFLDSIDRVFEEILTAPKRFPVVSRDARLALVERFPYAVFYRIEGEDAVVLSVFHSSRDPSIWQSRS